MSNQTTPYSAHGNELPCCSCETRLRGLGKNLAQPTQVGFTNLARGFNSVRVASILVALLLLAGCGDDDAPRDRSTSAGGSQASGYQPRRVAMSPTDPKPLPSDTPADPFVVPDPMDGGISPATPPDALAGEDAPALGKDAKPFADPMADTPDGMSETHGPQMPTQHSHWLRGSVFNAAVDVRVNNVFIGTFRAPVDTDITMKCRDGVNTVTFAYTPTQNTTASAQLSVLESEHTPPIAPLATFHSPPADAAPPRPGQVPVPRSDAPQTTTQTLTFVAK